MADVVHPVGIDLGTTQSVVAHVTTEGETVVLRNSEGDLLTPSVVAFEDDRALVGMTARDIGPESTSRVAECVKRDMGQAHYHRTIGDRKFPPEAIQGFILHKLNQDTVAKLGENFSTVIAVPAYFDESRRQATVVAGQVSGLDVIDIVNEPTAAALAFGQDLGYLDPSGSTKETLNVLVYDLGGGTFDVTVIRLEKSKITTLATGGDVRLGGYDWDLRLVEHVKGAYLKKYPEAASFDDRADFLLRRAAEQAKHDLSTRSRTEICFEHDGNSLLLAISRRQFEELTADLLERTAFTTRETVRESKLNWSDIDRVLLVGGSTRMPMVRQMISELSGKTPDTSVHPDEAVARGAAIFAQTRLVEQGVDVATKKLKIIDVASHSLGIEGIDKKTLRKENVRLITRNTALPKEVHRVFVTKEDNQQNVLVRLLEGESGQPEYCDELGRAMIKNLPPNLAKGTKINVVYAYDRSGRLSVRAQIPDVGSAAKIEIQRENALPDARLFRWKKIICRHGGYSHIEKIHAIIDEAIEEKRTLPEPEVIESTQPETKRVIKTKPISLKPAIPEGAPAVAAETLQHEVDALKKQSPGRSIASHRTRNNQRIWIQIIGYIVFSVLGVIGGYYLLERIDPQSADNIVKALSGLFK